ncbi:MAG: SDR family oxidoreductase [Candidatus Pacebacteria bacterium]|nr:SDR family oxidoreductase [Candidatus Paceibacterota bacterium]
MHKVLVTGGAGFIGSHLVDALVEKGVEVVVLDDLSTGKRENIDHHKNGITFIEGDVSDASLVAKSAEEVDVIFHLAAVASVQKSIEDPITVHRVNTQGTLAVFDAARKLGVKKVVYASSSAVYGDLPGLPKDETMPCCPKTPYGLQKMLGEGYAKLYYELHALSSVGLRFFNVFGPRQDASSPYSGVISIFKDRLASGQPITIYGDGETTRDFVYVADVVVSLIASAEAKDGAHVYNIGTGEETSLKTVVTALENALGVTADVSYQEERAGDIKRSVASIEKAQKELRWEPRVTFEEGIVQLAQKRP